jgi:hypothetical protein
VLRNGAAGQEGLVRPSIYAQPHALELASGGKEGPPTGYLPNPLVMPTMGVPEGSFRRQE